MYKYGYKRCQAYHTFFVKRHNYKATILNVYIDGIVVKSNDTQNIKNLKAQFEKEFETKDLGLFSISALQMHLYNKIKILVLDNMSYWMIRFISKVD